MIGNPQATALPTLRRAQMNTRMTSENRSTVSMLNEVGMLSDAELEKVVGGSNSPSVAY
jgi:hypothetical protein